jgi:hypothetical protein
MKVELQNFEHVENGISLRLVPETPIEEKLLVGMWKHGYLEIGHGPSFCVRAFKEKQESIGS